MLGRRSRPEPPQQAVDHAQENRKEAAEESNHPTRIILSSYTNNTFDREHGGPCKPTRFERIREPLKPFPALPHAVIGDDPGLSCKRGGRNGLPGPGAGPHVSCITNDDWQDVPDRKTGMLGRRSRPEPPQQAVNHAQGSRKEAAQESNHPIHNIHSSNTYFKFDRLRQD